MKKILEEIIRINQGIIPKKIIGRFWPNEEIPYYYKCKTSFIILNTNQLKKKVVIKVNDKMYVKLNKKIIREGEILGIYKYISKERIDYPEIYLGKINFGVANILLHIHPKRISYKAL